MESMEKDIRDIKKNVYLLLSAMKGNDLVGDGGIVQEIKNLQTQVENFETRVEKVELFISRINWTILLIVSICSGFGVIAGLMISYLSLKK